MSGLQVQVKRFQVGIESDADKSRHIECASEITISMPIDSRRLVDRAARDLVGRIKPAMCDPLACGHLQIERRKLGVRDEVPNRKQLQLDWKRGLSRI